MTSLYNCRHDGDQYRISKFDSDFNVESSYLTTLTECECPAGSRDTCRHRQMLPRFLARGLSAEWFYDFDRGGWVRMELPGALPRGSGDRDSEGYDIPEGDGNEEQDEVEPSVANVPATDWPYKTYIVESFPCEDEGCPHYGTLHGHTKPHSTAVSATDFDSVDGGSNPSVVANRIDRRGR